MSIVSKYPIKTEEDLLRNIAWSVLFNVAYHEDEIIKAHKHAAMAKALFARLDFKIDPAEALEFYDESNDEEPQESVDDFAKFTFGEMLHSAQYHEQQLVQAHADLAAFKALVQRFNIPESMFDDVRVDVAKRMKNED